MPIYITYLTIAFGTFVVCQINNPYHCRYLVNIASKTAGQEQTRP